MPSPPLPAPDPLSFHHRARLPSLTEFPDSPSVYSHAQPTPITDTASFRLGPDYGDETASTIHSVSTEDARDDSDDSDDADDASHRISHHGPRIRFHSRAPWETEDVVPHNEEPNNSPRSGTFGSKLKGKAARADSLIRTFTRGPSLSSRPSVDSARSQASPASSFDITAGNYSSSRGALYDLAKQSLSTASLSSSSAPSPTRNQTSARTTNCLEPSHYFPQAHGLSPRTTLSMDGMVPPSMPLPIRPSSSDTSRISRERNPQPAPVHLSQERHSPRNEFVHPYANPDLVVSYTPSPETIPSLHPISGDMSGSDSNCTITDTTSIISGAASIISAETPSVVSLTSRDHSHGNRRVNGKEISSPIAVLRQNDTRFLSLHPPPPGFDGPQRSNPTVTLISLQEAQARERFRGNTVHTTVALPRQSFPNVDNIPEIAEDQDEEMYTVGAAGRTRARSTSAGTRQKVAPFAPVQSQITETAEESSLVNGVPGRVIKHKKSGFMRLFGSRNSEGDKEKSPPPPTHAAEQASQIHNIGKSSKLTRPRVTKPPSSPVLGGSNPSITTLDPDGKGPSPRRRQAPSLSIVTKTTDYSYPTSVAVLGSPASLNFSPPPPISLTVPQSAPPGHTGFPGLQLRPVSGSFSSHFAGIVAGGGEDLQRDVHTPSSATSSNNALSPFTPVSMRRSDDASTTALETVGEENSSVKELQSQLVSAKKAWQQQIWELRGQIRNLTAELEDLRAGDKQEYCEFCGRGEQLRRQDPPLDVQQPKKVGVVNRPRARTGDTARFANGN